MASEYETVDVWIGEFPSYERLETYFREVIDPDDDDAPISEFAKAMREPYYDHDFVERKFHKSREPVDKLLQDHSYSNSYIGEVTRAAAELGVASGNTTVLVWGRRIPEPVSVIEEDYALTYIGRFECIPSQGS